MRSRDLARIGSSNRARWGTSFGSSEEVVDRGEPHVVSIFRFGSELHLAVSGLDDDAVLVQTGRERIRVENLSNSLNVRYRDGEKPSVSVRRREVS